MRSRRKPDCLALVTFTELPDGSGRRMIGKSVINGTARQIEKIASALEFIDEHVQVTQCVRVYDVFGRPVLLPTVVAENHAIAD